MPSINQLQTELQAIPAFGTGTNLATLVGAVSFVPTVQISPTYNLLRKPSGSALSLGASSFSSGVLTLDTVGLFQIVVTNAGAAGPVLQVLAVSAGANTLFGLATVQRLMSNPNFSAATCAASVELASPGGLFGIDARLLGGSTLAGLPSALLNP